jgi:hypothetical protein
MTAFWDTAPCSLLGVNRRFRRAYCLHHQDDETSVNSNETIRRYIPEGSRVHIHLRENLKPHRLRICLFDAKKKLLTPSEAQYTVFNVPGFGCVYAFHMAVLGAGLAQAV